MKFFVGDDWLASASSASRDSGDQSGASSLADQMPFELGKRAKHVEGETAAGRRGVDRPGQGSQAGAVLFQLVYGLDQMRERTREAIKL